MNNVRVPTSACETMIEFLEEDPYRFRSGYAKEHIWRVLKRARLSESQKRRLRQVAFAYLNKPMSREFWYMCRFIRTIADESFQRDVEQLARSRAAGVRERAGHLLAYLESPDKGAAARNEFRRAVREANMKRYYERMNQD